MTNTKSHTLSLHDALPIYEPLEPFVQSADEQSRQKGQHEHRQVVDGAPGQIKQQRENSVLDEVEVFDDVSVGIRSESTRLNSSHRCISYAVFCLKKNTLRI